MATLATAGQTPFAKNLCTVPCAGAGADDVAVTSRGISGLNAGRAGASRIVNRLLGSLRTPNDLRFFQIIIVASSAHTLDDKHARIPGALRWPLLNYRMWCDVEL